jgi:hypothetical protein
MSGDAHDVVSKHQGVAMTLKAKVFESASKSWDDMCADVSSFASTLGRDRVVSISMAAAGGTDWPAVGSRGTIIVWYWS